MRRFAVGNSLDGLETYFTRKNLAWIAWKRISGEKAWPGWPGSVFLKKKAGLDPGAVFLEEKAGLDGLEGYFSKKWLACIA